MLAAAASGGGCRSSLACWLDLQRLHSLLAASAACCTGSSAAAGLPQLLLVLLDMDKFAFGCVALRRRWSAIARTSVMRQDERSKRQLDRQVQYLWTGWNSDFSSGEDHQHCLWINYTIMSCWHTKALAVLPGKPKTGRLPTAQAKVVAWQDNAHARVTANIPAYSTAIVQ
jgi:hypothetical protein